MSRLRKHGDIARDLIDAYEAGLECDEGVSPARVLEGMIARALDEAVREALADAGLVGPHQGRAT